jgi:hypothetical protein
MGLAERFTLDDPLIAAAAREVDAQYPGTPRIGQDTTIPDAYAAMATSVYKLVARRRQTDVVWCAAPGCVAMVERSAGTCPRHGGPAQ